VCFYGIQDNKISIRDWIGHVYRCLVLPNMLSTIIKINVNKIVNII